MLPATSAKCPLCACTIDKDDDVISCSRCDSTYHKDCWEYLGDCAILGCQNEKPRAIELEISSTKVQKWALLHRAHTTSLLLFGSAFTGSLILYTMQFFLLLMPLGLFPSITVGMMGSSLLFHLRLFLAILCGSGLLGLLATTIPFRRTLREMDEGKADLPSALPIVNRMARLPFEGLFHRLCSTFTALLWASLLVNGVILLLSLAKGNFYHLGALFNVVVLLFVHFLVLPNYRKSLSTPQLPERLIKLIKCRSS